MGGDAFTFELFGLTFNWTNLISGTIVFVITFFLLFGLSRHLQMKPTGGQNVERDCAWTNAFRNEWFLQFLCICLVRLPFHFQPTWFDHSVRLERA